MTIAVNVQRPFTSRIEALRRKGMRFVDLQNGCDEARSSAWFNKLINSSSPWVVSPPGRDTLAGLSALTGASKRQVREWIAEEWYGVVPTEQSARVRGLAGRLDALGDEDFALVETLVQRLASR